MNNQNPQEQLGALFGEQAKFSDHKQGETIRFREGGIEKEGIILWVRSPGPAIQGGRDHPTIYVVDCDEGFPSMVAPGQIVEV